MAASPSSFMVQVDWKSTFNTVHRDCMLAAAEQPCPALLPMAESEYGWHSCLLAQSPEEVVSSQSRVRQGKPLGLLLFALNLEETLDEVAAINLAWPLAYADNTFLQGAPELTMRVFQALAALALPSDSTLTQARALPFTAQHAQATTALWPREPWLAHRSSGPHKRTPAPTMHAT
jgi:hypothetical protein